MVLSKIPVSVSKFLPKDQSNIQTCSAISNIMPTQNWFLPVVKTAMDAAVAVLIASSGAASTSAEI